MIPCRMCGALACDHTNKAPMEAVAWRWEQWSNLTSAWIVRVTYERPLDGPRVRNIQHLYTHPPQPDAPKSPAPIELSKNLGELEPDALPGELRERVAQAFDARRSAYEREKDTHDPLDDDTVTAWEKYDFACEAIDIAKAAILSLIQSERGGG